MKKVTVKSVVVVVVVVVTPARLLCATQTSRLGLF